MKLIRCVECSYPIALVYEWINCECGRSGGAYCSDGSRVVVAGPCQLVGIDNRVFLGLRVEAWPYDEACSTRGGKPKVTRLAENPGVWPDRVPV